MYVHCPKCGYYQELEFTGNMMIGCKFIIFYENDCKFCLTESMGSLVPTKISKEFEIEIYPEIEQISINKHYRIDLNVAEIF